MDYSTVLLSLQIERLREEIQTLHNEHSKDREELVRSLFHAERMPLFSFD